MITKKGVYLLEYNVRMGDPETQSVLLLMESDLTELILSAVNGTLKDFNLTWKTGHACCVVAASGGYPGNFKKGYEINIERDLKGKIFMAGVKNNAESLITNGGRVLAAASIGKSLNEAIENAYSDLNKVHFKDIYYRKDIGKIY